MRPDRQPAFGSNQPVGANFDPDLFSGWGMRPSDWAFGVSVQQQIFPRRRWKSATTAGRSRMFTTGGTATDNLAISPRDSRRTRHGTARSAAARRRRLPGWPALRHQPDVFGQVEPLVQSTKNVGDDTRVFNGVDATFNVARVKGFTFQGGTSTGKVTNDFCAIRSAVPEATSGSAQPVLPLRISRRGRRRSTRWSRI